MDFFFGNCDEWELFFSEVCGLLFTSIYMATEPRKGRVPIRIDRRKLLWRIGPLGKRGVKKGHKTATFVKITWRGVPRN